MQDAGCRIAPGCGLKAGLHLESCTLHRFHCGLRSVSRGEGHFAATPRGATTARRVARRVLRLAFCVGRIAGRVLRMSVTVDRTDGLEVVIATGLQAGETVVTSGQIRLTPGVKVAPKAG